MNNQEDKKQKIAQEKEPLILNIYSSKHINVNQKDMEVEKETITDFNDGTKVVIRTIKPKVRQ